MNECPLVKDAGRQGDFTNMMIRFNASSVFVVTGDTELA
jgi:hypothetical protein